MGPQLCVLLASLVVICDGKILGAFVLPHGGIALNPSHFRPHSKFAKEWAWQVHRAAVDVGKHIQNSAPDIIFLSTPHGVADLTRFMVYLNGRGNGTAETDNCQCPPCCYTLDVKLDHRQAWTLTKHLGDVHGLNVSGMSFFGPPGESIEPATLKWGEVIPLLFIKDMRQSKVVVLSQPTRRYTDSVAMIQELMSLGRSLYKYLEELQEKVAIIISADLAHTHDASGPYGYSPAAQPFDKAVGNWATTLHPRYLLTDAASYVQDAKSCGYTGLVMLHGLLDAGKLSSWVPVNHANFHPSYYGMMVASFDRKTV